jgi:sulfatase modifying factor 1
MPKNINSLNASEFDALLDQAFLELDLELPQNGPILEMASRSVVNYSLSLRSLFSFVGLNSVLLAVISGMIIYLTFFNSPRPLASTYEKPVYKKEVKQTEFTGETVSIPTKTVGKEMKRPAAHKAVTFSPAATLAVGKQQDIKEEVLISTYNIPAPASYHQPKDTLPYLELTPSEMKEINKSLVKVKGNLYASEVEISNRRYIDFLNSLKHAERTDLLAIAQIDTLKWRDKNSYNDPYVTWYHKHPAYQDYPVVNISHSAAILYCEWLTSQYNSNPKRKFNKVKFRLPTELEWMMAARGGDSIAVYPWEGTDLRNKKGMLKCNFKRLDSDNMGVAGALNDNADVTAPVYSYWPNKLGLYNMSGNVAEMVAEKGIAKGGAWNRTQEYLEISNRENYDGNAQTFVGFRYFMDILELEKTHHSFMEGVKKDNYRVDTMMIEDKNNPGNLIWAFDTLYFLDTVKYTYNGIPNASSLFKSYLPENSNLKREAHIDEVLAAKSNEKSKLLVVSPVSYNFIVVRPINELEFYKHNFNLLYQKYEEHISWVQNGTRAEIENHGNYFWIVIRHPWKD